MARDSEALAAQIKTVLRRFERQIGEELGVKAQAMAREVVKESLRILEESPLGNKKPH